MPVAHTLPHTLTKENDLEQGTAGAGGSLGARRNHQGLPGVTGQDGTWQPRPVPVPQPQNEASKEGTGAAPALSIGHLPGDGPTAEVQDQL